MCIPVVCPCGEACGYLPTLDGLISRAGVNMVSSGGKTDTGEGVLVPSEGFGARKGCHIPQLGTHIGRGRGEQRATGGEADTCHRSSVPLQGALIL